jgi:tetratricopeptide (TPR) repeat protein
VDHEEQEVAQMKRLSLVVALGVLITGNAAAQTLPSAGLAAEGDARWEDALRVYREQVATSGASADLWLRIADIEARLGRADEAVLALQAATAAAPADPAIAARLSQAYAAQGHATAALRAIEAALQLRPTSDEYLRAHATLATWAGEYDAAAGSYRRLRQAHPDEHALALALARVSVWGGSSDAAASAYREYLARPQAVSEAWLELARTESWRGNFAAALAALGEYDARFGRTDAYARERVAVLARGGQPREALRELQPLLAASPLDFDLNLSRAIALASARRHGAALSTLERAGAVRPDHADTRAAESLVRSMLGTSVGPSTTFYNDSDGLQTLRVTPRFDLGFRTDTRLHGGYEHIDLQARAGSGLEQISGARTATVEHAWAGLSQRLGSLTLGATIGQARPESHQFTTYGAFVRFVPADSFAASVERSSGFAAISPRTAGLGLTRLTHRAQLDWTPGMRYHLALEGSYEDLSDGNARWEVFVSPRAAVTRSQRLNLDLGLLIHQFGAAENLDNGYYDPRRYEYYSVVLSPYWKVSDNVGVAVSAGLGGQRDDTARRFRLGSNASVEATFGIYERWLLKVHGSTTNNRRLDSGAFRGVSGGVVLLRRF